MSKPDRSFTVADQFYLNGEPFKIISGAIHYFRVVPEYWQDRLEKLKALGCNTVETYVPWNMHEPREGEYHFSGMYDLRKFIQTAEELGLYVILRPSPYICAEWEFGGLPFWLLRDGEMKLRFSYPPYLEKIDRYYRRLFEEFKDLQISDGGPIILMQVENEYGSYGNDKNYLYSLIELLRKHGATVPLVTSDGPWHDMLDNGSVQDAALPTINCGSGTKEYFARLREFHGEERPLMVMEFWIGWFDAWGDKEHHTRDAESAAAELSDILSEGSVNIYMFHGGTNFGFTSGANYYDKLSPDTTSYDYDALLTEWGDITPKYKAFQQVIARFTELPKVEFSTHIQKKTYGEIPVKQKVSLYSVADQLAKPVKSPYPLTMEALNQSSGYVLYQADLGKQRRVEDFRLIQCADRAQVFINQKHIFTKYDLDMEEKESFDLPDPENELMILVENMGRVNYSVKMNSQYKGIKGGVIVNGAFQSDWKQYVLSLDHVETLDFTQGYLKGTPAFYRFELEIGEKGDTFLDFTGWGKGVAFINGFNLGRFWEVGPQKRLYLPAPLLKHGMNEVVLFETEGKSGETIRFEDSAGY
ncbi:beta-galactosidase [Paenibacillus antibioticophila]|uniref:Beta-galactosidase n=1 Tax=Paenibacillus antibioticophila TaxID=1274374 RepID=A0A919XWC1_9BACL|nr:beta-galactosidase family protein [Paenibacillus antibioticophila]GIO37668.1 beta-galactosidase [Paenibacillus antibioticophila]